MNKKNNDSQSFSTRLKKAREMKELTQEQLAELTNMPASSIGHFEIGTRKPSFDTLLKLADTLNITTDFLLGRVDNPNLAESSDPLYRDGRSLTENDRKIAESFINMLKKLNEEKRKVRKGKKHG